MAKLLPGLSSIHREDFPSYYAYRNELAKGKGYSGGYTEERKAHEVTAEILHTDWSEASKQEYARMLRQMNAQVDLIQWQGKIDAVQGVNPVAKKGIYSGLGDYLDDAASEAIMVKVFGTKYKKGK